MLLYSPLVSVVFIVTFLIVLVVAIRSEMSTSKTVACLTTVALLIAFFWVAPHLTAFNIGAFGSIQTDLATANQATARIEAVQAQVDKDSRVVSDAAESASRLTKLYDNLLLKSNKSDSDVLQVIGSLDRLTSISATLTDLTELTTVILEAQNDQRSAYLRLKSIAEDGTSKFQIIARDSFLAIGANAVYLPLDYVRIWPTSINPQTMGMEDFSNEFSNSINHPPTDRIAIIQALQQRTDITKDLRLKFLLMIIDSDPSLKVALAAARAFGEISGMSDATADLTIYEKWWSDHQKILH